MPLLWLCVLWQTAQPSARKNRPRAYAYYRCIGSDGYRFGGQPLCDNKQVRTDRLEQAVWAEICQLLENPSRLAEEYQRRLAAVQSLPGEVEVSQVNQQIAKLRQGIVRLIDGYAEGYLDKAEAEPRIRRFKERLQALEAQARQLQAQAQQQSELQLIIGCLEEFSEKVKTGLDDLDWLGRRELIRTLVKRVEIDQERVNVVFRVEEGTFPSGGNDIFSQHCRRADVTYSGPRYWTSYRHSFSHGTPSLLPSSEPTPQCVR